MDLYIDLSKLGWSFRDIDEMDIHYFLRVNVHAGKKQNEPTGYIDQIPGF